MDLRYPIGEFKPPANVTPALRNQAIEDIARAPGALRAAVKGLSDKQLDTPYRDGGWTVRQVIHHVPDSHVNSYVRFRLALTEDQPPIKTYAEAKWAELEDAKTAPVDISLNLLDSLHDRWVRLLRSMRPEQFERSLLHPEHGVRTIDWMLFLYAWHGKHHTAHITGLRKRNNW